MAASEAFFTHMHEGLVRHRGVTSGDACFVIATELADLLKSEGRKTHLDSIRATGNKILVPRLPYGDRISWHRHDVCHEPDTDLVHDPWLPRPLKMQDYLVAAFGQNVVVELEPIIRTEVL